MRLILSGGITFNRFCPPPPPEPRQDPLAGGRGLQYSPQIPDPKPFTAPPTHLKISGSAICHTSHFKCLDVVTYGLYTYLPIQLESTTFPQRNKCPT